MEIIIKAVGEIISALCEIIPLSGDGQARLAKEIYTELTGGGGGAWAGIFIRLGVLAAVVFYLKERLITFGKAVAEISKDVFSKKFTLKYTEEPKKYALLILGGWIPVLFALFLASIFAKVSSGNMALAISFAVSGIFLVSADRIKRGRLSLSDPKVSDGPVIGIFRILGMIPGISGMGGTLFATLLSGYDEDSAIDFSLILLIPALLGGIIIRIIGAGFSVSLMEVLVCVMSLAVSGILSLYAIKFIEKLLKSKKLKYLAVVMIAEAVLTFLIFMRG